MDKLSCVRSDLRQYEKQGLPTRFHFSNNRRIEDIVLDVDPGRFVDTKWYDLGNHGYDNYFETMNVSALILYVYQILQLSQFEVQLNDYRRDLCNTKTANNSLQQYIAILTTFSLADLRLCLWPEVPGSRRTSRRQPSRTSSCTT